MDSFVRWYKSEFYENAKRNEITVYAIANALTLAIGNSTYNYICWSKEFLITVPYIQSIMESFGEMELYEIFESDE